MFAKKTRVLSTGVRFASIEHVAEAEKLNRLSMSLSAYEVSISQKHFMGRFQRLECTDRHISSSCARLIITRKLKLLGICGAASLILRPSMGADLG